MSHLVIPVSEKKEDKFIESIKAAALKKPDMVELRTDCLHNLNYDSLEKLINCVKSLSIPMIVTCRDPKEGGMHDHSQLVRLEILCEAIRLGADYIDCEFLNYQNAGVREAIDKALEGNPFCRLILSVHNFEEPFCEPASLYENMRHCNKYAIIKMAYMARDINDCFSAFDLLREKKGDLAVICMGAAGEISRIAASKFGSFFTFAACDGDKVSAPGQLTADCMREVYRFDKISLDTPLYGIIAEPVGHSASPAVYNASFEKTGYDGLYLPLLVEGGKEGFDEFMDNVMERPGLGFRGFSVTIPHKNNAFEYVRKNGRLDEKAEPIGAINTISIADNSMISGFNTDYNGALKPLLRAAGSVDGKKAAVIGAGGVSKAVVAGLCDQGAVVTIFNRTLSKAEELARIFGCGFDDLKNLSRLPDENYSIVVNCTSVGMSPNVGESPLREEWISEDMTVFDTVYNPLETKLLTDAKRAAAKTVSGFEMFVEQALEQYQKITSLEPDRVLIEKVLREKLKI